MPPPTRRGDIAGKSVTSSQPAEVGGSLGGLPYQDVPGRIAAAYTGSSHAAARLLSKPPGNLHETPARLGQTPHSIDNPLALFVRQPTEPGAAANLLLVMGREAIHRTLEKSDPLAAVQQESPTDQPVPAPSGDCFGRHAELPRQFVDRQHALAGRRGKHFGRWVQALDAHGSSFVLLLVTIRNQRKQKKPTWRNTRRYSPRRLTH